MKYTQRLDYGRLAEVLHERGLAGLDAIRELLQLSQDGGMPFCEALVTSNLVSDWDLSKVVCETFQLPFLPVDLITPNPAAMEEIDTSFFNKHQVVPVDVFGQVLTVAMPALVPAEVLAQIAAMSDFEILPLVGTVESNRRWIGEHMAAPVPVMEGGWESMFDAADAGLGGADEGGGDALSMLDDPVSEAVSDEDSTLTGAAAIEAIEGLEIDDSDLDLGSIEALPADDLESSFELDVLNDPDPLEVVPSDDVSPVNDIPQAESPSDSPADSSADKPAGPLSGLELPPMPDFNLDDQREAS